MRIRQTRRTLFVAGVLVVVVLYVTLSLVLRSPPGITIRLPQYPAAATVCTGSVTPACAITAANRVKHDVAFIQASGRFRPRVLVTFEEESIHDLLSDQFVASLYSQPKPTRVAGRIERRITISGFLVTVRRAESAISMEWTRNGMSYALDIVALRTEKEPDLDLAVSLVRDARYQEPSA
ncbi:MAG: hypothetical protein WAT66_10905 [Actinomycetota bacterium]